jgi:hypothetical protein
LASSLPNPLTTSRLLDPDPVQVPQPKPTFSGIIYYKHSGFHRTESSNPNNCLLGLHNHNKLITVTTQYLSSPFFSSKKCCE